MSDKNLQLAAQCWCDKETSHIEMDSKLAIVFSRRLNDKDAEIAELKEKLKEALYYGATRKTNERISADAIDKLTIDCDVLAYIGFENIHILDDLTRAFKDYAQKLRGK